jgi:hypothetical protein
VDTRLGLVAPDLGNELDRMEPLALRALLAEVIHLAVERTGLVSDAARAALAALDDGRFGATEERGAILGVVDDLDEVAWDLQERSERREASQGEYLAAFRRARAASAIASALDPDAFVAATEGIYEAEAAISDLDAIRSIVAGGLSR